MSDSIKLDPPWRQAVDDAQRLYTYGDLIPKDWLMEAFCIKPARTVADVNREKFEWLESLTNFRDLLSEKFRKELRPVSGRGYEVIMPAEQSDFAMEELRREFRSAMRKTERRLTNIEERMLTQEQLQHNAEQRAKMSKLRSFARKSLRGGSAAASALEHRKDH